METTLRMLQKNKLAHPYAYYKSHRITGSMCRKILQKMTSSLLKSVLYPKQLETIPQAVKWGIDNKPRAHREYLRCAIAYVATWKDESHYPTM